MNAKEYSMKNELMNEPNVSANSLLEEMLPLLHDYFIGELGIDGKGITYCMPNGQKFVISAEMCR
ncbi:MAG: hypothetical protein K2H30_01750 [Clostridia bacterium]|nr:hypothetical protein [Clostridia bacterium]